MLLVVFIVVVVVLFSSATKADESLCSTNGGAGKNIITTHNEYTILSNGYVCAVLNSAKSSLEQLRGDYTGKYNYGHNTLVGSGIALERETDWKVFSSVDVPAVSVSVLSNSLEEGSVLFVVQESSKYASENWRISLNSASRYLQFDVTGQVISQEQSKEVKGKCLRRVVNMLPTSLYALFDRGVVQMKAANEKYYASRDYLPRFYSLGGSGGDLDTAGNVSLSIIRSNIEGVGVSQEVVLFSSDDGPAWTGLQEVIFGSYFDPSSLRNTSDSWTNGWSSVSSKSLPASANWNSSSKLYPNNFDFPTFTLPSGSNLPDADLQAMLTGIYGSAVGCLNSHDNEVVQGYHVAQIATTPHHPDTGYSGTYNYFDPDNYIGTASMLYSGDAYVQNQVRLAIERTGSFINNLGQVPHHFNGVDPTYQALSGETQTGPNVFWALSALNYAKTTGDLQWLSEYMPTLRTASAFLFDMIDPDLGLANCPGSLMIDVFIRANFTTDSNSMLVGYFREFGDAEEALGNATGAAYLRNLASTISSAIDAHLWSTSDSMGQDHYITQLNADKVTTRDFVDYDSNTIALAFGIPQSLDRVSKLFARIDRNPCSHGRATWVSEVYYGSKDTTNGNTGDSNCSMARIGWFDALARKRYSDLDTFNTKIMDPLVGDVNRWTWIHERYACDGSPQTFRTPFYFEYPAATAMLARMIRYGVEVGFLTITISPFGPSKFSYHIGDVNVDYDADAGLVRVSVGAVSQKIFNEVDWSLRTYVVAGQRGNSNFTVSTSDSCSIQKKATISSDSNGVLTAVGFPK